MSCYLQNHWQGYNIDEIAAQYFKRKDIHTQFRISVLKNYVSRIDESIFVELDYTPMMGSFFKFLAETQGKVFIQELVRLHIPSEDVFQLEVEWKRRLKEKYDNSPQMDTLKYWDIVERR